MPSESCGLRGAIFEHQWLSNKELFGKGALPHWCWSQNVQILLDAMSLLGSVKRQRCKTVEPVGQTALVTQAVCPEGGGEGERDKGLWGTDFQTSSIVHENPHFRGDTLMHKMVGPGDGAGAQGHVSCGLSFSLGS